MGSWACDTLVLYIEDRTRGNSLIRRDRRMKASPCMLRPPLRCGVRCVGEEEISDPFPGCTYIMYARELVGKAPCRRLNLCVYLEVSVIFSYLCTRKRNERPCGDAGSLTFKRSLR